MKRILFLAVIISVAFAVSGAQIPRKNIKSVYGEKRVMTGKHISGKNSLYSSNTKYLRALREKLFQPKKSSTINSPLTKAINLTGQFKSTNIASVPEKLIGTFKCKGISYFGGIIAGETVITADKSNPSKIWFSNLVPEASNQLVYGIVEADQKSISIPQGQRILTEGTDKANLAGAETSTNITGQFDSSTGIITITTIMWGSEATDGSWYELFGKENVTYTRSDMLPPVAAYRQPQGGLFLGLDPDTWGSYSTSCLVNPPFTKWNWQNTNNEEDVTYSWTITDSISGKNITSDADSLLMDVESDFYSIPKLKATNKKGISSTFILGADYQNKLNPGYALAGGNSSWMGFDSKCDHGVANLDNGFTFLSNGNNSYFFGTGATSFAGADYSSLLVQYEKPLSTLYFEGVNVYLSIFDAPVNTPFTMNVVLADKDTSGYLRKGKLIASSTVYTQDVVPIIDNGQTAGYTMKFTDFESVDEFGFKNVKESFEMNEAFYLELTGFNTKGVTLAVCTEEINPSDGDSRSGFMFSNDDTIYSLIDHRQTMYFNLAGMAYSYITVNHDYVYDNRSGGTYNIEASPFFDTLYFGEQYLPNWVHVEITDQEYSDTKWNANVRVTLDPLTANEPARYSAIVLKTPGATKTIPINQGGNVSTGEIKKVQSSYAYKNQQGFIIKYPREMNSLTVYNGSGIIIGHYKLPETGSYQLNVSLLSNGLYLLKLQGNNGSQVLKVVK
jgi:hypothetical protein